MSDKFVLRNREVTPVDSLEQWARLIVAQLAHVHGLAPEQKKPLNSFPNPAASSIKQMEPQKVVDRSSGGKEGT